MVLNLMITDYISVDQNYEMVSVKFIVDNTLSKTDSASEKSDEIDLRS